MSLPKEVFTELSVEDFTDVGAYTLDRAEAPSLVPLGEVVEVMKAFPGYVIGANYVGSIQGKKERNKDYGKSITVGMLRLGVAIREWFYFEELSGRGDVQTKEMQNWMRHLTSKQIIQSMNRYFQLEQHQAKLAEQDERFDMIPHELVSAHEDYPAFVAFGDLLEEKLMDSGIEEVRAGEYSVGVDLGTVAIREAIEIHNLKELVRI